MQEYAVLKNRTAETVEFRYDGAVYQVKPAGTLIVELTVAQHLFTHSHIKRFTRDGRLVYALGLQEVPDRLIDLVDPEWTDVSPVELADAPPLEGWREVDASARLTAMPVSGYTPADLKERLPAPEFVAGPR